VVIKGIKRGFSLIKRGFIPLYTTDYQLLVSPTNRQGLTNKFTKVVGTGSKKLLKWQFKPRAKQTRKQQKGRKT
jgi:hypothetical protein